MDVETLTEALDSDFYTGVPDSRLKPFCSYLMQHYDISPKHIIAANEGNSTALAAGYHLATGKIPVVYMQNSGIGNMINPAVSLLHEKVYAIPCIFIIGWRGEPGTKDEPQHRYQGEITLGLLEAAGIQYEVIDRNTTDQELVEKMQSFRKVLDKGQSIAFVVRKGGLSGHPGSHVGKEYPMRREEIIRHITEVTGEDPIVCTTGKAGRELYELRELYGQSHRTDFLTVGSMGHGSSIALGIALHKPDTKVWCIDGDGALLMHMGALAVIGSCRPENLVHIVINNEAHETVGGMPTVAKSADLVKIAEGCGYPEAVTVEEVDGLKKALKDAKSREGLFFIEVKCAVGAREDLGRPTVSAEENKEHFMKYLEQLS